MSWEYTGRERPSFADKPRPGQRSVWDFPRPPAIEPDGRRVMVRYGDIVIAETTSALTVLETASAPGFYLPIDDVRMDLLRPIPRRTVCEWKGSAHYFDLELPGGVVPEVGWSYPQPRAAFAAIAEFISFYPARVECYLDDERVEPQPGGFYGGWVTADLAGPIKGAPGTAGW